MTTIDLQSPLVPAIIGLAVWSLFWKGLALWRAADRKSKPWFVVLLVLNTAGILEIVYLFVVSRRRPENGS